MYSSQIERPIPKLNLSIYSWSSSDPSFDYRLYVDAKAELIPKSSPVNHWHTNTWVPPILTTSLNENFFLQSELWGVVASAGPVTLHMPTGKTVYQTQACLQTPYAFFYLRIMYL